MSLKVFLYVNLIIMSFSLKETITLYKAMSELGASLQKDVCRLKLEGKDNYDFLYVKPCDEGYHCGEDFDDIGTCIPNYIGQKVGEACNYKDECIFRECDLNAKICTYKDPVYVDIDWSYRCANGLFYDNYKEECIDKEENELLDGYCLYTKKNGKEVSIQPNKPFQVCGESGIVPEGDPILEPNTPFIKISEIGELKLGATTVSEYACESGSVSKSTVKDFWICDKITGLTEGTDNGKKYADYIFQIHGNERIYEDNYDGGYFYLNQLTGEIKAFGFDYQDSFAEYLNLLKKYKKKCVENTHDYYFRPFDCGIKELSDLTFFFNNEYFYKNNSEDAKMVKNYLLNQNIYTKYASEKSSSSSFVTFKNSLFILFVIFYLL